MIPYILSQQVNQGLKDFLSTTFHSTNPFFHNMLERFLDQDGNLSKGPYISLQLPFQKGQSREFFPRIPMAKDFSPLRKPDQGPDIQDEGTHMPTLTRTVTHDTLPDGPYEKTIEYLPPFDKCNREKDYETVWAEFEQRL